MFIFTTELQLLKNYGHRKYVSFPGKSIESIEHRD